MGRKKIASFVVAGLIATTLCGVAVARVEKTLRYSKTQSYHTALRFLRVDQGYKIIEKDLDSGYLLFEYTTEGSTRVTSGSIEVIEREEDISLVVQLPQMPRHHETMLATGLLKKLRDDYGEPRKQPKAKVQKPPPSEIEEKDKADSPAPAPPLSPPEKQ
jgi:hypothetical protein